MRVALGGADRKPGHRRDLREAEIECVLERNDGCLGSRQLVEMASQLTARLGVREGGNRIPVGRRTLVLDELLGAAGSLRLGDVLAGVDDEPMQPRRELGLAPKLPDPDHQLRKRLLSRVAAVLGIAEEMQRKSLHPRRVALTESREGARVARLRTCHEDRVRKALVDERRGGTRLTCRSGLIGHSTPRGEAGLHGALNLVAMALVPELVMPRLRGRFGQTYLHVLETPTTQAMFPPDAPHGAVALAEHQTEGKGRLGRDWIDEPGTGLTFSILLRPPGPVARWPELTIVAAEAVAGAIGPEASIKQPNDILVDGKKVAGILAEAGERVVLGIGVNVGRAPWPGAGFLERDRLELLAEILSRFETGYERWASSLA